MDSKRRFSFCSGNALPKFELGSNQDFSRRHEEAVKHGGAKFYKGVDIVTALLTPKFDGHPKCSEEKLWLNLGMASNDPY